MNLMWISVIVGAIGVVVVAYFSRFVLSQW